MIQIELLAAYAARHKLGVEPAFVRETATLVVDLTRQGQLVCATKDVVQLIVPRTDDGRTSNILPRILDKAEYTFEAEGASQKSRARHQALVDLMLQLADDIQDEAFSAMVSYICNNPRGPFSEYPAGNIAFRVEGEWVYERPEVTSFFRAYYECRPKTATCRITGKLCAPPPTHPKIENLLEESPAGTKSTSSTFISFNVESARYSGLMQAANFPLCDEIVYGYTDGLNHLVERTTERRHRSAVRIGNEYLTVLWTQDGRDLIHYLNALQPEAPGLKDEADDLLRRAAFGEAIRCKRDAAHDFLRTQFMESEPVYILTIKAHRGRIAIYGWEVMPLGMLARNLCQLLDETGTTLSHLLSLMGRRGKRANDGTFNPDALRAVVTGSPWPPKIQQYVMHQRPSPLWLRALARNIRRTQCPLTHRNQPSPQNHPPMETSQPTP